MDSAFWQSIAENEYAVPDGHSADELAPQLVPFLASTDMAERDGFGYMILATWMVRRELTGEGMLALIDLLRPMLRRGIGERETDSVFGRSFAAVMLWQILNEESKRPFMDAALVKSLLPDAISYLRDERDLRGFVRGKGWAHSTAHAADFLWGLARSEYLAPDDLQQIMDVIAEAVTRQSGYVYIHHEDERLTRPVGAVLRRDELGEAAIEAWLAALLAVTELGDPAAGFDPGIHSAYTNTKNLLRSIYVQARFARGTLPKADLIGGMTLDTLKSFKF